MAGEPFVSNFDYVYYCNPNSHINIMALSCCDKLWFVEIEPTAEIFEVGFPRAYWWSLESASL